MAQTLTGAPARFAKGLREMAPGTFAWLQPNGGLGEANAGLVVGEDASLLIDTLWDQTLASEMLEAMRSATAGAPIRTVINTHSDGDHWWGNRVVPADAEIITGSASRAAMDEDISPRELALLSTTLGVGRRLPALGPRLERGAAAFAPFRFSEVRLRYPDRIFAGREALDVGGREVQLIEVGPAHTKGDCIVYVPDVKVAFAADILFVGATPVMWVGPVEGWVQALDVLLGLEADVYVAGHGDLAARSDVEMIRDYWLWLRDEAATHHRAGRSRVEAARAIMDSEDFAPWRAWVEPERTVINVDAIYRGLEGRDPVGPRSPQKLQLFADMGTLARESA